MVAANDAPLGTASFTVTVDVRHGLTTGISAEQRTNTVRALANGNMGWGDFVRPGHVFPLIAREGRRPDALRPHGSGGRPLPTGQAAAGRRHLRTWANDDGTVMIGAQITAFAETHKIKRISVADLIAYRQAREKLVERIATFPVEADGCKLTGYVYVTSFDLGSAFRLRPRRPSAGVVISRPACTGPTSSPTSSKAARRSGRSSPASRPSRTAS